MIKIFSHYVSGKLMLLVALDVVVLIKSMRGRGESLVERGGEHVTGDLQKIKETGSLLTPPVRDTSPIHCAIEWPWGATIELKEHLNIGRDFSFCPDAVEMQKYRHVSRKHAALEPCAAGVWVRDLHSHNGTFVNDEEVPSGQAFLVDADARLRCGPNFVIMLTLTH